MDGEPSPSSAPPAADGAIQPFDTVSLTPDFELDGAGSNVDSIAFWEAPDADDTLMFVTAKSNQLVEVWRHPFDGTELPPLTHSSFGTATAVNGVAVDQAADLLYVAVSAPASTVSTFTLPSLEFVGELIGGAVDLGSEPNLALMGETAPSPRVYVSGDDLVHVLDATTGEEIVAFEPETDYETLAVDDHAGIAYIPDESAMSGVHAYSLDGAPYEGGAGSVFGSSIFQADAEGILVYRCNGPDGGDDGRGWIVVSDQRQDATDFEFFDRQTWEHLGTLRLSGVTNTDGVASTQRPLPSEPMGLFVAVNDDGSTVGIGWDTILGETGLSC